jgi:hypothetical protein
MDKNKCPKTKIQKNFTQKYSLLYNKLKYLLKEKTKKGTPSVKKLFYLSIITCFEIFLIILSSFSSSLSPEPPIDSTIILLY